MCKRCGAREKINKRDASWPAAPPKLAIFVREKVWRGGPQVFVRVCACRATQCVRACVREKRWRGGPPNIWAWVYPPHLPNRGNKKKFCLQARLIWAHCVSGKCVFWANVWFGHTSEFILCKHTSRTSLLMCGKKKVECVVIHTYKSLEHRLSLSRS